MPRIPEEQEVPVAPMPRIPEEQEVPVVPASVAHAEDSGGTGGSGSCSEITRGSHAARLLVLRPSGRSTLEQLSPKGLSRFWCGFA